MPLEEELGTTKEDSLIRKLWLNVILRAVEDSQGKDLCIENPRQAPFLAGVARKWLSQESPDLIWVCHAAGLGREQISKLREMYGTE